MLMPMCGRKGRLRFFFYTSCNVAFLAHSAKLAILQADVWLDHLHVRAHQQLPERVQCRLDSSWQKRLQGPWDRELHCHGDNFTVAELAPGLLDKIMPALQQYDAACLSAGGRYDGMTVRQGSRLLCAPVQLLGCPSMCQPGCDITGRFSRVVQQTRFWASCCPHSLFAQQEH
jgi:hypothetical protein